AEAQAQAPGGAARRPWLFYDLYAEVRAMLAMYVDRRYRPTWTAWVAPPLLLAAMLTGWFWFPGMWMVFDFTWIGGSMARTAVPLPLVSSSLRGAPGDAPRRGGVAAPPPRAPAPCPAMIRLGVNIDHVATVRQARRAHEPDPVAAAVLAILGGADGITIHLREDRRHIQDR